MRFGFPLTNPECVCLLLCTNNIIQITFADATQKEARQAELDRATAAVHACLETEAKQACDQ